jgi:hypothetical protein
MEVPTLNIIVHAFLVLFAISYMCLAIHERRYFRSKIIERELKRIVKLRKAQSPEDPPMKFTVDLTATEASALFKFLDDDDSGFILTDEILPWLSQHYPIAEERLPSLKKEIHHKIDKEWHHGVQLAQFKALLTCVVECVVADIKGTKQYVRGSVTEKIEDLQLPNGASKNLNEYPTHDSAWCIASALSSERPTLVHC